MLKLTKNKPKKQNLQLTQVMSLVICLINRGAAYQKEPCIPYLFWLSPNVKH